ncbi:unnamed protein product [Prorocentrum cordatum]|uniref:Uncharacterized protein n=1 Tax=Prorocentrum cordatum TaxID=2364126 RepID=A0ABN9SPB0_9DINO|nr:unnamed protein product [Polarella glacialis]
MNLRISPPEHCQAKTGSGHRCSWEKHTRKARKEEGGGEREGRQDREEQDRRPAKTVNPSSSGTHEADEKRKGFCKRACAPSPRQKRLSHG